MALPSQIPMKGDFDMNRIFDRPEQATGERSAPSRPLTSLGRMTALALLGIALTYLFLVVYIWWTSDTVVLPALAFVIVAVITAGIVAADLRWAPVLGALVALALAAITLAAPLASAALLHPATNPLRFSGLVIVLACALTAIGAGAVATIQIASGGIQHAPHWLGLGLTGLAGMVVGMIVVVGIVTANPPSSTAPTTTNGMPTVHLAGSDFLTNVVLVPKGAQLLLVDDDSVEHIITNGAWPASGPPQAQVEPGAPAVRNLDIKGGSAPIGPFPSAGVFHLYCTLHRSMNLTVVVQ
jgi:hypothetical protein